MRDSRAFQIFVEGGDLWEDAFENPLAEIFLGLSAIFQQCAAGIRMQWKICALPVFGRFGSEHHAGRIAIKEDVLPLQLLQFVPPEAGIDGDQIDHPARTAIDEEPIDFIGGQRSPFECFPANGGE